MSMVYPQAMHGVTVSRHMATKDMNQLMLTFALILVFVCGGILF